MTADVELVRADNPSPLTLDGTNTWLLGRDPCWIVDAGPALPDHVTAVAEAARRRGGAAGIVLTHDHGDHVEGAPALSAALGGIPVAAARGTGVLLAEGDELGPLRVVATPGHAVDHLAFLFEDVVCTGDAVLGAGSVFVAGDMGGYLRALERLRALQPAALLPGHGPRIDDPQAHLTAYLEHRLAREAALLAALDAGARTVQAMLDAAWPDVPDVLRPAAAVTLGAHLEKLEQEGRLPEGVQRP